MLLTREADPDAVTRETPLEVSALMLAIVRGHPAAARALIETGADLSIRGSGAPGFEGKTALDLAEARGDREVADVIRRATSRPKS
jgi:ankyrin repeat protein